MSNIMKVFQKKETIPEPQPPVLDNKEELIFNERYLQFDKTRFATIGNSGEYEAIQLNLLFGIYGELQEIKKLLKDGKTK